MLTRLLTSGFAAGIAAGLIATLLQLSFVLPVLFEAERYESGELVHFSGSAHVAHDHADDDHDHDHDHDHAQGHDHDHPEGWARHALTLLANVAVFAGYGLMLAAAMGLAERRGLRIDARLGAVWGLAGFVALHLATAAGLPHELPGAAYVDTVQRQIWWAGTVVATLAGLVALAYGRGAVALLAGVGLIVLPHVLGAPHADALTGVVPPELAALFVSRSLAVLACAFVVLGAVAGALWADRAPKA